jgi:uncharacterized protein with HEPN domain
MASDAVYIKEIADNIHILESFWQNCTKDSFLSDIEKQFAAARAIEIIGEASGKLSENFKSGYPEIDWRGLKACEIC